MRKLWVVVSLLCMVVGCSKKEVKEQTSVCTFVDEDSGIEIQQTIKLHAGDDELYTIEDTEKFTFENVDRYHKDIEARIKEYKKQETCKPNNKDCFESSKFSWYQKDDVLSATTTIDVLKAVENEEIINVYDKMPKDDEYISLKKTKESLIKQGYDCKDEKSKKK